MKVTIVPIMISAFGRVTKGLLKGLEDLEVGGRVETIQTMVWLRMAREESWIPVTQSPAKDDLVKMMIKALNE